MGRMETRNANADGTLIASGDAGCTIHAERVDGLIRLNCTTPWDTWVGVDLTVEQAHKVADDLRRFADGLG